MESKEPAAVKVSAYSRGDWKRPAGSQPCRCELRRRYRRCRPAHSGPRGGRPVFSSIRQCQWHRHGSALPVARDREALSPLFKDMLNGQGCRTFGGGALAGDESGGVGWFGWVPAGGGAGRWWVAGWVERLLVVAVPRGESGGVGCCVGCSGWGGLSGGTAGGGGGCWGAVPAVRVIRRWWFAGWW